MVRLLIILSCTLSCLDAFIQKAFIRFEEKQVVLYDNFERKEPYVIIEDNPETCYNVEIIGKTNEMYRVKVFDSFSDNFECMATGWIRKENVGVYGWTWDKDGVPYERLYKYPDKGSEYQIAPACSESMILLDYTKNGDFVKVKYYCNDTIYCGWLDRYCPDCNACCN